MQHVGRCFHGTQLFRSHAQNPALSHLCRRRVHHQAHQSVTSRAQAVPNIVAHDLSDSQQPSHVGAVHQHLKHHGILKISLGFADQESQYLKDLIVGLHKHHRHGLPISHSASRGWFWDVRPSPTVVASQPDDHQARSETLNDFPWHTDCSYEHAPPQFFALHVLRPDNCGGGTLSVMKIDRLSQSLSSTTRAALLEPDYRIAIPPEFIKHPDQRHIIGGLFAVDEQDRSTLVRFRGEIVTPLSSRSAKALDELKKALQSLDALSNSALHLTPADLPEQSIILLDNHRWLHSRNNVKDPARHLRRVRWNAVPFPGCIPGV